MHACSFLASVPSMASRNSSKARRDLGCSSSLLSGGIPMPSAMASSFLISSGISVETKAATCSFRRACLPEKSCFSVSPAALPSAMARSNIFAFPWLVPSLISQLANLRPALCSTSSCTLASLAFSSLRRISFRFCFLTDSASCNSRIKRQPSATSVSSTSAFSAAGTSLSSSGRSRASMASAISRKARRVCAFITASAGPASAL
mmetsp:Transcript_42620/g.101573  ORF Transcript_42620/g.101573 Transcript_42620/m.101573 type:complete len:205 (+) Transcript_42620:793-1407(+)